MIKWHSTHYKLIMQNQNVNSKELAKLIGISVWSLCQMRKKLGLKAKHGWVRSSGIRFLRFNQKLSTWVVRAGSKSKDFIGSSSNFEKAVEILDKHLFEVEQGFIKL